MKITEKKGRPWKGLGAIALANLKGAQACRK